MSDLKKVCFFTGHRKINLSKIAEIKKNLRIEIENAINDGVTTFIAGGALGFDTLAAEQVISLKEKYSNIQLVLYLPCQDQDKNWSYGERLRFNTMCSNADIIHCVTEGKYTDGCMQKRNLAMVEASDMCIAYMKNMRSGTSQTINMAEEKDIKIINIAK